MSSEPQERFGVTAEDLRRYDWQTRIAGCAKKEIRSYYTAFTAGMEACKQAGDDLGQRVFLLLYGLASFRPNFDSTGTPYGSMWTNSDGSHSLNAEDLTDADLTALGGIVNEIEDPEFRARVADVLWVTKKDHKAARSAIAAFLKSAERLKTDDLWPPFAQRLERAAQISARRGFESENAMVVSALEAAITEFESNPKSGLLCHRLMSVLLWLGKGDNARYSALAERLAQHFAGAGNWHFSEDYWQLTEQWHRRAQNAAEAQRCQIAAAECNVSNAEAGLVIQGAMFASHWLSQGLEALRRARAGRARIDAVHRRLIEVQKLSLKEMQSHEIDVDVIPGFRDAEKATQAAAEAHVRGHDFRKALARFANVTKPTNLETLKEQHAETSKNAVFAQIVGASTIDHAGKVSDKLPPLGTGTADEQAEALRKNLVQEARRTNWPIQVLWKIEPARHALIGEHAVRRLDLLFLVLNNPFIPQGHEGIYLRGLQAGFLGDWLTAMHLLIPQVEASIREVLQQHGHVTSTLKEGIQTEQDLNTLLFRPEVETVFGPDILFDLRGLLIERFGHNLRNESAHGLLPESGFYQPPAVYLWWLILHLCWKGFHMVQIAQEPD